MIIYKFGSIDQHRLHSDNSDACRTLLHTFGESNIFMAEFPDQETCIRCTSDAGSIKSCAAGINGDYNDGRISEEEKRDRYLSTFIPLTENCISEWGLDMVPLDIRCAIADVRSNLGLPVVLWPAILYFDGEVGPDVIVPTNVDEFGMLASAPVAANPD